MNTMPFQARNTRPKENNNRTIMNNREVSVYRSEQSEIPNALKYKKLVVPNRMRSIYWKYFGFPASSDGVILTRAKIICTVCKKQIIYNRNTSNLRTHLQSKHKHILGNIDSELNNGVVVRKSEPSQSSMYAYSTDADGTVDICDDLMGLHGRECIEPSNSVQLLLDETADIIEESADNNIAVIFPNDDEIQEYGSSSSRDAMDVIIDFIISDLQSPHIVEGKGFQRLIASLSSPCNIPSKQKLVDEIIPKMYDSYKYATIDSITTNSDNLALSIEQWTNNVGVTFVSFYVHYQQTDDPVLLTRMLSSVYCTGIETVDDWNYILDKLFLEWNVSATVIRGVISSFSNPQLKKCLIEKNFVMIPCFLYVLQNACQNICFEHEKVADILSKCRAVIAYIFQSNNKNIIDFQDQEYFSDFEDGFLINDYPEVWLSTYYMLKGLLLRRSMITSLLNNGEESMVTNLALSDDEWSVIQDIIQVLDPLKIIVTTLNEEKSPLISLLKPIIWQVTNSHFDIRSEDSDLTKNIKTKMKEFLIECYSSEDINTMLQIATTLDPRFKTFLHDSEHASVEEEIMNLLIDLIETEGAKVPDLSSSSASNEQKNSVCSSDDLDFKKKQNRQSGINMLLGNICISKSSMPADERAKVDFIQYQSENCATLEDCPLDWWNNMAVKCPNLSRLAQRYNCIPAIAIPTKHVSVANRISYSVKRNALSSDIVDKFLFLYVNRPSFSQGY